MPLDVAALIGEGTPPWRIIAERKIAAWVEAGGPDQLTNKGQQLDLSENPFTPKDLRMAFKVLKNAGVAPEWVELGKEIETLLTGCREELRRFKHANRADALSGNAAGERYRRDRFVEQQRARLDDVNRLIARFNVSCPMAHLHRAPVHVERELDL